MRCNSDGSNLTIIVDVSVPVALTLDTYNRFGMLITLIFLNVCFFTVIFSVVLIVVAFYIVILKYPIPLSFTVYFSFEFQNVYILIAVYDRF